MPQWLSFVVFLVASHFGVLQLFRLSTYHRYFWRTVPLLVAYGAFAAWLFYELLRLHEFFIWQVVLASAWLFIVGRRQSRAGQALLTLAGDDPDTIRLAAESTAKTSSYYAYSAFIYIISFSLAYLWLYNK